MVLRGLADLPVAIRTSPDQRGVYLLTLEGGQRDDGPPPDSGFVGSSAEDGGQSGWVAQGPQRGYRRLAAQRVFVMLSHAAQRVGDRWAGRPLTEGPRRHFGDERLAVLEQAEQGSAYLLVGMRGGQLGGASPNPGVGVTEGAQQFGGPESFRSGQSPERGQAERRISIAEGRRRGSRIAGMAGEQNLQAPVS